MEFIPIIVLFILVSLVNNQKTDPWEIRCHVCKATVQEMQDEISKIDPNKIVDVSGFRLDAQGNSISKTVPYSKSELYLTELMENICSKMDEYAKVIHKKSGRTAVIKFMMNGQMNPTISEYEFVQDGDLNKSLQHYCLEILEDHEESFLKSFMTDKLDDNVDIQICSLKAKYCKDEPLPEEYKMEAEEEFNDEL